MSVNAKIRTKTIKNALILPYECILQDKNNKEYVFCIEDGLAKKRFISTGHELDDGIEVKAGIKSTDEVIINPGKEIVDKKRIIKEE